jgi:dihydrofolate reductase
MRELIYYVAVTLDGRIAGPGGEFDFFPMDEAYLRELHAEYADALPTAAQRALGVEAPRSKWDTVIMGRGTYEPALQQGIKSPYAHLDQHVVSTTLRPEDHPEVTIVGGDPLGHVRALKARPGGNIWLCGGGKLASQLAPAIDRLVLKLNPVVAGDGVPLFAGPFRPTAWKLTAHRVFDLGVVLLSYARA